MSFLRTSSDYGPTKIILWWEMMERWTVRLHYNNNNSYYYYYLCNLTWSVSAKIVTLSYYHQSLAHYLYNLLRYNQFLYRLKVAGSGSHLELRCVQRLRSSGWLLFFIQRFKTCFSDRVESSRQLKTVSTLTFFPLQKVTKIILK